jgi:hypothetical protein
MALITIRQYHNNTNAIQYAVEIKDKVTIYLQGRTKAIQVSRGEWETIAATFTAPVIPPTGTA